MTNSSSLDKCSTVWENHPVEHHPFEPFLPANCRLLMLGSFPPAEKRWTMHFYYPNFTNDMWRIFGICFFRDKEHFINSADKTFKLGELKEFLTDHGIGLYDTAVKIRRLKNTASDKDLEVVEATNISTMLKLIPLCKAIAVTGQKATDILCKFFCIEKQPEMGRYIEFHFENRKMRLYRMPSSSRAYPMKVEKKAETYKTMFENERLITMT